MKAKKKVVSNGHLSGNRKVAKSRGKAWAAKLISGKHEALFNPTQIRLIRLKKNINQADVAKKVGVSQSSFGSIERGKRVVSKARALLIASKLGSPLKDIFFVTKQGKFVALSGRSA